MVSRIFSALWGKFESKQEVQKFGFLATIFFLLIGTYWSLRPIKDSIFGNIVGMDYQPWAKVFSLFVIVPLVLVYSKLIDLFPRHKVFYAITAVYGLLGLLFAWIFMDPVYGLANTQEDPTRIVGWLWYVFVESYGSLIVALFWAFTTDTTKPESAKRGFPLIILLGQIGNMVGPYFLTAKKLGFTNSAPIAAICGILTFMAGFLLMIFMKVTPKEQLQSYEAEADHGEKEKEPGFFEGLKLLLTQGYLLGIFFIVSVYEIIITTLDFFFKVSVKAAYPIERDMAAYLNQYAVWTGVIATLCVVLGINNVQRYFGTKWSLILTPTLVAVAVLTIWFVPTLAVAFWIMVAAKAVNYALNGPTLKQLYIPTSKDAKYKSQAWIEMFGSRGAKAAGSGINMLRGVFKSSFGASTGAAVFLTVSSCISFGLIGGWLLVALFVAKKYNTAIDEKKVVC